MGIKVFQLQKRDSYEYKHIQDKYAYSEKNKACALADGTTQSFCSELWAELITNAFVEEPVFETRKLIERLTQSAGAFRERPFEYSQNPAKASLEREKQKKGGTATLIGVKLDLDGQVAVICCGDSNLFIVKSSHFFSFPYSTLSELDANTTFLNTEKLLAGQVDDSFFVRKKLQLDHGDKIILASDALSRLFLKNPDTISKVLQLPHFDAFHEFCQNRWNDKTLEEDDITAIVIEDGDFGSANKNVPPPGFSFPNAIESTFISTPPATPPNHPNFINQQAMPDLQNVVSHLQREISALKKTLILTRFSCWVYLGWAF